MSTYGKEYQAMVIRLKQARLAAGLTQLEVAHKLRKPQSYISKIESGERRLDPVELKHLARLYKKPFHYFMQ